MLQTNPANGEILNLATAHKKRSQGKLGTELRRRINKITSSDPQSGTPCPPDFFRRNAGGRAGNQLSYVGICKYKVCLCSKPIPPGRDPQCGDCSQKRSQAKLGTELRRRINKITSSDPQSGTPCPPDFFRRNTGSRAGNQLSYVGICKYKVCLCSKPIPPGRDPQFGDCSQKTSAGQIGPN